MPEVYSTNNGRALIVPSHSPRSLNFVRKTPVREGRYSHFAAYQFNTVSRKRYTPTYICMYTGLALVKRHRFSRWNSLCRAYYRFYVAQSICSWRDKDDRDVSKHTVTCCCRDARFSLSSLNGTIHSCPRAMFKLFRALISKDNMTKDKYYDSSAMWH